MTFTSGLFAIDLDHWDPDPTPAWADCEVDLMGQPIVRFHYVAPDGFGTDTYGWYHDLFLRVDYLADSLDLVIEIEGEWSIEASFYIAGLQDVLVDARWGDADPEDLLALLLDAAGSRVRVLALTEADVERVDGLPLIAERSVAEEMERRGRWKRPQRTGSGDTDETA